MKNSITLLLCLFGFFSFAQSNLKPLDLVKSRYERNASFEAFAPFTTAVQKKAQLTELDASEVDFDILNIDVTLVRDLASEGPEQLTLSVPFVARNTQYELDLVKVDIFTTDFQVTLASTNQAADVSLGAHYRGIVKGDESSVVSLSFFKGEVMGMIATNEGNLVLGKMEGNAWNGEHILYDDRKVLLDQDLDCGTLDDDIGYKPEHLEFDPIRATGDCIRLYIEVDNDIYNNKGGQTGTTNYITGLMNQVITLYANENIASVVSELVLWDVTSPYSSTSSSGMLSDFQAYRNGFNGDLAQLFSYQASGGIAAGFSGLCNSNPDNSMCFSSIDATYQVVPTYSWSVMVATHEFGHLWGSRHTHACVWNGNNTAIDGCAGSTEGTCALPGYPSGGGTIMSYCHLQSVGINFNLGFGPQPGNVIRNSVANATCTAPCGPPSCDDGIQNGEETGVDCGGPECPACPTCEDGIQNGDELGVDCGGANCAPCPCTGQDVTLTIVLDNYPGETSWAITANGLTYASGGPYTNQPAGSTVVAVNCLNDGCYTFTIYDSYGDGICCGFGNGSYSLTDASGNVLASGGQFGSFEATEFCLSSGCTPATNNFPNNPLTHSGSGSSSTTLDFGGSVHQNVSFTISDLDAVTGGKPANRYIEEVTITYQDENGNTQTYGTVSGANGATADVNLPGNVLSVTASLFDGYDGNAPVTLSVSFSPVNSCDLGGCPDEDEDGVCDPNDVCPFQDDTIDVDNDGIPDCIDDNLCALQPEESFNFNPLTHTGAGSSSSFVDFGGSPRQEVSFTISGLDALAGGKPSNRYIELVTVEYDNGSGNQVFGSYSGANVSSADVVLPGDVVSVTVTLEDGYSPTNNQPLSVNLSAVSSCVPITTLPEAALPESKALSISLFPNPVSQQLTVQVDVPERAESILRITDINGQTHRMQQMSMDKGLQHTELDVSALTPGMYFVYLQLGEQVVTKKFVVMR